MFSKEEEGGSGVDLEGFVEGFFLFFAEEDDDDDDEDEEDDDDDNDDGNDDDEDDEDDDEDDEDGVLSLRTEERVHVLTLPSLSLSPILLSSLLLSLS
jgi:ABC-type Zn2+ transport system substrate-binding protein/surface adhesin